MPKENMLGPNGSDETKKDTHEENPRKQEWMDAYWERKNKMQELSDLNDPDNDFIIKKPEKLDDSEY